MDLLTRRYDRAIRQRSNSLIGHLLDKDSAPIILSHCQCLFIGEQECTIYRLAKANTPPFSNFYDIAASCGADPNPPSRPYLFGQTQAVGALFDLERKDWLTTADTFGRECCLGRLKLSRHGDAPWISTATTTKTGRRWSEVEHGKASVESAHCNSMERAMISLPKRLAVATPAVIGMLVTAFLMAQSATVAVH